MQLYFLSRECILVILIQWSEPIFNWIFWILVNSEMENVRDGRHLKDHIVKPFHFPNEKSDARKGTWVGRVPQLARGPNWAQPGLFSVSCHAGQAHPTPWLSRWRLGVCEWVSGRLRAHIVAAVATGSIATFWLIEVRDARSTSEMETLPACVMLCDVSGRVPLGTPRRASGWKGEQVKAVGPTGVHLDWIWSQVPLTPPFPKALCFSPWLLPATLLPSPPAHRHVAGCSLCLGPTPCSDPLGLLYCSHLGVHSLDTELRWEDCCLACGSLAHTYTSTFYSFLFDSFPQHFLTLLFCVSYTENNIWMVHWSDLQGIWGFIWHLVKIFITLFLYYLRFMRNYKTHNFKKDIE